jgi:hypothetical protein
MPTKAVSPTGARIRGVMERVLCDASVDPASFRRAEDGSLDFEYESWTDIEWDTQETFTKDGKRLFKDQDGEWWTEDEIKIVDADEDADEDDRLVLGLPT